MQIYLEYIVDEYFNLYLGYRVNLCVDDTYIILDATTDLDNVRGCDLKFTRSNIKYSHFNYIEQIKIFVQQNIKGIRKLLKLAKYELKVKKEKNKYEYKGSICYDNIWREENKIANYKRKITNLYKINRIIKK